jgi:hypothetical protein
LIQAHTSPQKKKPNLNLINLTSPRKSTTCLLSHKVKLRRSSANRATLQSRSRSPPNFKIERRTRSLTQSGGSLWHIPSDTLVILKLSTIIIYPTSGTLLRPLR